MRVQDMAEYLRKKVMQGNRFQNKEQGEREFYLIAATFDEHGRMTALAENNIWKTHPMMKKYATQVNLNHKIYLHAEISAIIRSRGSCHSLIVIRVNKNGAFSMAKPCPVCQAAILDAKVEHLYYSDQDGDIVSPLGIGEKE